MDYGQLWMLGAVAGLTIFLGLPLAPLQNVSSNAKGFLNPVAMGILVFRSCSPVLARHRPPPLRPPSAVARPAAVEPPSYVHAREDGGGDGDGNHGRGGGSVTLELGCCPSRSVLAEIVEGHEVGQTWTILR